VPQGTPRLVITDVQGRRVVNLTGPLVTLGRRADAGVRLTSPQVSRLHAQIVVEPDKCVLHDAGSRSGTFVNDEASAERVLSHGDRIRLGTAQDVEIRFLVDEDLPTERTAISAAGELRQIAALLDGLRALGSGRVLDEVLALVLDSAIEFTGAQRGFVMLADAAGRLEFKLARARGRITLSGRNFETSRKVPEEVFATGQGVIVRDLMDGDLAGIHGGTVALGIRHVLCSPLRLVRYVDRADQRPEEKPIGVMYLDSREPGALQSASARSGLETLGVEAAIAIENARLYREALENAKIEQELRVAAAIQRALLPAGSRTGPFFTAAAASVPCRAVGGDFFDYVDLTGGFGWILGDVSGKGSPAALLAAAALGMFDTEAAYHTGTAAVVPRLNRGVFRRGVEGRFITAFYGHLGPDGVLTYSNAGHNAPILVGPSGPRRLEVGGLVLGAFEQAAFEEERIQLSPGDLVVAFSDGVSEALSAGGDEFGDERVVASVTAAAAHPPEEIVRLLLADVHEFCRDAAQNDDVTVVAIRYDGAASDR